MEPLGRWHGIGSTEVGPFFVARDRTTMSIRVRDAAETIRVGIHDGSKLERRDASTRRNLVVAGLFVAGVLYTVPQSHDKDPRYYPLDAFRSRGPSRLSRVARCETARSTNGMWMVEGREMGAAAAAV